MKFSVGDTVVIKRGLQVGRYGKKGFYINSDMANCSGKRMRIREIETNGYIKLDGSGRTWIEDLFEPKEKFYLDM